MKLVTFQYLNSPSMGRLGVFYEDQLYDVKLMDKSMPGTMKEVLRGGTEGMEWLDKRIRYFIHKQKDQHSVKHFELMAPLPQPASCRKGKVFSNHHAVMGPGEVKCMPDHLQKLTINPGAAVIIGKKGRNITAEQADNYIAGYMARNDLSADGQDFLTVLGPWLVTADELAQQDDLEIICQVNGVQQSYQILRAIHKDFAALIEQVSYGCELKPGDVISSTNTRPTYSAGSLRSGDLVELSVTGLGSLNTRIAATNSKWSLLDKNKINYAHL